ncbi:MAG: aldehyde dehydrogenase family protein [Planctomycetota bacterium]|nr:aldehyde dehydrogenase family protein [Planctomycetota bacterium]
MASRGHNWIDGALAEAAGSAWFELSTPGARAPLGRWPRSADLDLEIALEAARLAEPAWLRLGLAERHERLSRAADRLLDAPDPEGTARRALGFERDELERHLLGLDAAVAEGLTSGGPLARGPLGARDGPCLLAPVWSSGWHAPARAILFALRAGRPVILAPDGRLPCAGDALRDAFAELPRGVFQVLHDDGRTLVRAATRRPDLPTAVVSAERLDADFTGASHVEIARPRRVTAVVDPALELDGQIARILDAAIGRARALSGSRSGQVGRLITPERAFSRVGEIVLERLAASSEAERPLPIAAQAQASALEAALALGLDEGATAVLTGSEDERGLFPVVFTNVEPAMRVARLGTPCGLLLLLRAVDLRSAHSAAGRLDQEVRS